MFNFENLQVWHRAIDLADEVYRVTKVFPSDERFGLTTQLRRAAVSVSSNIAEGSAKSSTPDQSRFIEYAVGSVFEVVSQARIALRQGFLPKAEHDGIYEMAGHISRMLSGLKTSLLARRAP